MPESNHTFLPRSSEKGFVLVLVVLVIFILTIVGFGLLTVAYGARLHSLMMRDETMAKMTAEAGYEEAICWMSQQKDLFGLVAQGQGRSQRGKKGGVEAFKFERTATLANYYYDYVVCFDHFLGGQPVYLIESTGYCDRFRRQVSAYVVQAITGWEMGSCRIPVRFFGSLPEYFTGADVIRMPVHIDCGTEPDDRDPDIYISMANKPVFEEPVSVAESRYRRWDRDKDKYAGIIDTFQGGIFFDQPNGKITDRESIRQKAGRFARSTASSFNFSRLTYSMPQADARVPNSFPAVQLEFYIGKNNQGMVRITNNCTVRCLEGGRYDYMINPVGAISDYVKYYIYGYHYIEANTEPLDYKIEDSYVVQEVATSSGKVESSTAGGQIYVEGNVIIGGEVRGDVVNGWEIKIDDKWYPSKVKGKVKGTGTVMVVATGNIWIVSPIEYDEPQEWKTEGFRVPAAGNLSALGLFSQYGVVRVIDPAKSLNGPADLSGSTVWTELLKPNLTAFPGPEPYAGLQYKPVGCHIDKVPGLPDYARYLPSPLVVQAAITAGGGGWGADNVGRRLNSSVNSNDVLVVVGAIAEAVRGPVAEGQNGFKKSYHFDKRFLSGILPGDMWLQSKFVPAPGGWSDYRP
jgi:hypothetical protein